MVRENGTYWVKIKSNVVNSFNDCDDFWETMSWNNEYGNFYNNDTEWEPEQLEIHETRIPTPSEADYVITDLDKEIRVLTLNTEGGVE